MTDSRRLAEEHATLSDAVVDGLFRGIFAGFAMAVLLVVAALVAGEKPETMLGRFSTGDERSAVTGMLLHFAVSGVYGIVFGLGWHGLGLRARNSRVALFSGLVYGALLFWVARVVVPAADSPLQEIAPAHFAIAHLVFGAALGVLFGKRNWQKAATFGE